MADFSFDYVNCDASKDTKRGLKLHTEDSHYNFDHFCSTCGNGFKTTKLLNILVESPCPKIRKGRAAVAAAVKAGASGSETSIQHRRGLYQRLIQSNKKLVTGNVATETLIKKLVRNSKHAELWPENPAGKDEKSGKAKNGDKGKDSDNNENSSDDEESPNDNLEVKFAPAGE
ncbi:hypothetical protein LguiA_024859 [Lonicera macranthoides]